MSNERFDKVDAKLEKIDARLDDIHITQVAQAKDINHHIERTDTLQNIVMPLQKKYEQGIGAIKLLGFIISCAALFEAAAAVLSYLHK